MNTETNEQPHIEPLLDEDYWYDDLDYEDDVDYADAPERVAPVKASAYVPGTNPNQLRERLASMLQLSARAAANLPLKLFRGVRPANEPDNEQTPRNTIHRTQTANRLRKSEVNGMVFYSRADLTQYGKSISYAYEDLEVLGGANEAFIRDALHQAGYVDRTAQGVVFFASFKTKFSTSVLCFMGGDNQPTAEFLDVVLRRVPAVAVTPAEVPKEFYYGKRRTRTKEEREREQRWKQERQEYRAYMAATAAKVWAYRDLLNRGVDPLEGLLPAPTPPPVQVPISDDFFDGIDDEIS